MEENKNHIDDMQKLAEEGWKQMHETLRQHGLSSDTPNLADSSRRRNIFLLIAACLFFFLIFTYPYILNHNTFFSTALKTNAVNSLSNKSSTSNATDNTVSFEDIASSEDNESSSLTSQQKQLIRQKINDAILESQKESFGQSFQNEKKYLLQKFSMEKPYQIEIPGTDSPIDSAIKIEKTIPPQQKPANTFSKKAKLFAGAGINISSAGNKFSHSFDLKNFNIHPSVTVIIPLTPKLNLHTGLSAFSMIHGKEVSAKEKELVNNLSNNVYYNIKTTSIIKASYFDLPVTVHYSINKNWSVGSGIQLSRLYKVNIKEVKESFDYNNTLYSATVDQYNATPMGARAAFQKKVEIKKMEPRFIAETNLQQGNFLFSAGFFYSLEKSIILKDGYNSSHQYRNEYFKLGIQYRICGGK
ncbi:MAG: outer membrane beta-barrel protein [Ginsengibacter sp.]